MGSSSTFASSARPRPSACASPTFPGLRLLRLRLGPALCVSDGILPCLLDGALEPVRELEVIVPASVDGDK